MSPDEDHVKIHGEVVGFEGKLRTPWEKLPPADPIGDLHRIYRSREQIVTNNADDPIDADKLREHMRPDHE